jgi:Protein of unknown function (DUF3080)
MRPQGNVQRIPCRVRQLACCAAMALLQACQQGGPDTEFDAYLNKLGVALSVKTPAVRFTRVPQVPDVEEWQLDIPASNIDGLDILQISGCAVKTNISKRQTSLGQSAKPSQRLLLDLEYLRLAPQCINRLHDGGNDTLAAMLQQAWHEKQAQLPASIFNATLGSEEYRAFWLTTPIPGAYPRASPELTAAALEAINKQVRSWIGGKHRANNRDFELLLSAVSGGDAGTQLQDWTREIDWLITADAMAKRQLPAGTSCTEHKRETVRLITQARTYFDQAIKPLINNSQQRYQLITAPINTLEALLHASLPEHYRSWMDNRKQNVATLVSAPDRHVSLLNRSPQACTDS